MKTRPELMILMLGLGILSSVAFAQPQQPAAPSSRTTEARTPLPSVSDVPSVPSVPRVPAVPSVPSVPPVPETDPLGDVMFPPDLIMRHSRELGLTDEQKSYMRGEIQRTTTRFNELQWQLLDAMEALHKALESNPVNEQQALAILDKVLDTEREVKHLHVGLGIRLKNHLTPEQQAKLQGMKRAAWPEAQPGPRPTG